MTPLRPVRSVFSVTLALALALSPLAPAAWADDSDSDDTTSDVTTDDTTDDATAVLGETLELDVDEGGSVTVTFTADADGSYVFTTGGDTDTWMSVADADGTVLATDDDSGSQQNALVVLTLAAGDTVTVTISTYDGTEAASFTFSVTESVHLSTATVSVSQKSVTFTGDALEPSVTVTDSDGATANVAEYTVAYADNTWPGTATATVTDLWGESAQVTFGIVEPDATPVTFGSETSLTIESDSSVWLSYAATADGTANMTLASDSGGRVSFSVQTFDVDAQTAGTVVWGWDTEAATVAEECTAGRELLICLYANDYENDEHAFTFTLDAPAGISGGTVTVAEDGPFTFTGSSIEPAVTVTDADGSVVSASEYTVEYDSNRWPGTASVLVSDAYDTTLETTFEIVEPDAASVVADESLDVELVTDEYAWYCFSPEALSAHTFSLSADEGDWEYELALFDLDAHASDSVSGYASDGAALTWDASSGSDVWVRLCACNWEDEDEPVEVTLLVSAPSRIDAETAEVTLAYDSCTFDGTDKEPDVTVTSGGEELDESDWYVTYANNFWPGTARVLVSDWYATTIEVTFEIAEPSTDTLVVDGSWTSKKKSGAQTWYSLTPDEDCVCTFEMIGDPTDPFFIELSVFDVSGDAWETASDEEEGTVSIVWSCEAGCTYYIMLYSVDPNGWTRTTAIYVTSASDDSTLEVALESESFAFSGAELKPAVTVTWGDEVLTTDDYTVAYEDNIWPGTATVTVTALHGLVATATFEIVAPDTDGTIAAGGETEVVVSNGVLSWWVLEVDEDGEVTLVLADAGEGTDGIAWSIRVYDVDGQEVFVVDGDDTGSISLALSCVAGGTYYVRVYAYDASSADGTHSFTLAATTDDDDADDTESGDATDGETGDADSGESGDSEDAGDSGDVESGASVASGGTTGAVSSGSTTSTVTTVAAKSKKAVKSRARKRGGRVCKNKKLNRSKLFVVKGPGTVTWKLGSVKLGKKKVRGAQKKKLSLNAKTGALTVKKGLKSGTYKIKVRATVDGKTTVVTIKVRV